MLTAIIRRPLIPAEDPPILVLLHGLGSNEQDLMGLSPELDPSLLIASIRAPLEYGPNGYAWFEIRWDADGVHVDREQVLASRDLLIESLKELPEALGVRPAKLLLGGFSQGAMMSLGVALAEPSLVSGVISMSGRLVPDFLPSAPKAEFADVPFLVQHGELDSVLPVEGSRSIRDYLIGEGCEVTYSEYRMAHEISRESIAGVRQWLTERLPYNKKSTN